MIHEKMYDAGPQPDNIGARADYCGDTGTSGRPVWSVCPEPDVRIYEPGNDSITERLTFGRAYNMALQQIDLDTIPEKMKAQASEVALIIAEVYLIKSDYGIRIGGEMLDGNTVQEIFRQLTADHVELVLDNFNKNTYLVRNKKLYLRTALYNSVFELESAYINQVNHDLHGKGNKYDQ